MTEYDNLYEALSETQNHIEQPKKDATNPMFKASYVTLDAVIDAIVKARKASGAKFFFTNVVDADKGLMITRIIGYGDTIDLVGSKIANDLGNRGTNSAQAEGSALTYARRYSLSMAFGIASDVDDDGNSVAKSKPAQTNSGKSGTKKTNPLHSEFGKLAKQIQEKNNVDEENFFKQMSSSVGLEIMNFYDFVKLSENQKKQIVETLKTWV